MRSVERRSSGSAAEICGFSAVPRGRGDGGLSQDRLLSVHENPTTQAREGHLVNALVQRGDEGRSTLR